MGLEMGKRLGIVCSMKTESIKVGDRFTARVDLKSIKAREMVWIVTRENKSSFSVSARDEFGSQNLYLDKKTGQIRR